MTTKFLDYGNIFSERQLYYSASGANGKYDSNGRLNENPYSLTRVETRWFKNNGTFCFATNILPGRMSRFQKEYELTFKLQSKISSGVKGHDFHLGKFLGEGKQSVEMTVNAIRDVVAAMRAVKHGNPSEAIKILSGNRYRRHLSSGHKGLADRWLELQYGWLPLYQDVHSAWDAYAALNNKARETRLHMKAGDSDAYRDIINDYFDTEINYRGRGLVIVKLREQLSVPRSLGLLDPAGVAWEITPWSFAIDWFLPIGKYLENLNIIPNINGTMYSTTTLRYMTNIVWKGINPTLGYSGDHQYTTHLYLVRQQMTNIPVLPTFVNLPKAMSPNRIYNAIALGLQRI